MSISEQLFRARVNRWMNSVDEGAGLRVIRTAVYFFCIVLLAGSFAMREFRGLENEAAMDSAQLGRNLARTGRYHTSCVRPVSMAAVSERTFNADPIVARHPELFRPPGYPAVLAGAFRLAGFFRIDLFPGPEMFDEQRIYPAEQWVIIPINLLFTVLSGLFLYLLGKRLFSQKIAWLGVTVFFLMESVWRDSLRGDGMPLVLFFTLAAAYWAVRAVQSRRKHKPLRNRVLFFGLSVLFSAAAVLTHYASLAIIAGIALFLLTSQGRRHGSARLAFSYAALIFLLIWPWLLRNYRYSGSPLGLAPYTALADSVKFPEDTLMRTLSPGFSLKEDLFVAREKWGSGFNELFDRHFAALAGGLILPFFLVSFFCRFVQYDRFTHCFRIGLILSLVLFFTLSGFFGEEALRFYHLFRPFATLYGLAFLMLLLDRMDFSTDLCKSFLTGLVIVLSSLPMLFQLPGLLTPLILPSPPYPPYYVPFVMRVSALLEPQEVLCTDMPWATAWYGQRTSVLLPNTIDEFYEISTGAADVKGLYLTTLTKDRPFLSSLLNGTEREWMPLTTGRIPDGFPLRYGFNQNRNDQLFLTDRIRWGDL